MRRPTTSANEWVPILKRSDVRMQQALRGCINTGLDCCNPAGLASHGASMQTLRVAFADGHVLWQMSTPTHD